MYVSTKSALALTALAALGLAAARPVAAQTVTVGTTDGVSDSRFPLGFDTQYAPANYAAGSEYQELYPSTAFTSAGSPFTINNIAFASAPGSMPGQAAYDLTLRLSTTSATSSSLSNTFAANEGANQAVVFSGPLTANIQANGTFDLVFPTTPFVYNPSQGNLLLDVVLNQTTQTTSPLYFLTDTSGSTARVFQAGGTGAASTFTFGPGQSLYTQFNAPPAVPEASTTVSFGLLLALGLGAVVIAKKRKQSA